MESKRVVAGVVVVAAAVEVAVESDAAEGLRCFDEASYLLTETRRLREEDRHQQIRSVLNSTQTKVGPIINFFLSVIAFAYRESFLKLFRKREGR